jgi:hypothetical protein
MRQHTWDVSDGLAAYIKDHGLNPTHVYHNASVPVLYEAGLRHEAGTAIADTGAFVAFSRGSHARARGAARVRSHPPSARGGR